MVLPKYLGMTDKASLKRLQVFNFKLNALLEVTQAINANLPVHDLLQRYQNILQEDLSIGRIVILKYGNGWECILDTASDSKTQEIDIERDLLGYTDIRFVTNSDNEKLRDYDFVIPVYNNNNPLAFILIGDIEEEMPGVSPVIKHLNFIQTISNIIIVAIENIRLFNESLKQEALKKELELASRMQNLLIPKKSSLPNNSKLNITAYYQPHFEVGGDYYDYIEMGDDEFGFCIADVSGKGMAAALLMSNFQATLRAIFTRDITLPSIIERLNERVSANANYEKFITFFIGRYNFKTHELEYINAGHNPPILCETKSGKVTMLSNGCVGLGMLDIIPNMQKGHVEITETTKILCYTDGLVEFLDDKDISFTVDILQEEITNADTIDNNIIHIIDRLSINESNTSIFDDITILGIQINR
jgi:phosphoserine phosphatase RsbU/P